MSAPEFTPDDQVEAPGSAALYTSGALDASAVLSAGASGVIDAVCVVDRLHPDSGSVGTTAIDKRAVDGPVKIGKLGLYADIQADRANHGGADQAVYIVDAAEADYWAAEIGREIHPGVFGENILVRGLSVDDLEIGARLSAGDAILEATAPRTPCATFERWIGESGFRARFHERGRVGVYFRVLRPGDVAAGDVLSVQETPGHGVSVAQWFRSPRDPQLARRLQEWSRESGVQLHAEITRRIERILCSA